MSRPKMTVPKKKQRRIAQRELLSLCKDKTLTQTEIGKIAGMSNWEVCKFSLKHGIKRKNVNRDDDFSVTYHTINCAVCIGRLSDKESWKFSTLER